MRVVRRAMNVRLLLAGLLVCLSLTIAAVPASARPSPVCADDLNSSCPGFACVDDSLDGYFQGDECIQMYCPTWGCCTGPCPPPTAEPASHSAAVCTGYMNVLGSKQRTCVDPAQAPECPAWTEGWSQIGYYRACYGTDALCTPAGCAELNTCNEWFCLA